MSDGGMKILRRPDPTAAMWGQPPSAVRRAKLDAFLLTRHVATRKLLLVSAPEAVVTTAARSRAGGYNRRHISVAGHGKFRRGDTVECDVRCPGATLAEDLHRPCGFPDPQHPCDIRPCALR